MKKYKRKSREDRIKEIHTAAIDVFLKKGYRNTTMENIVEATTLSKGGLYHYYNSTKEIIFDLMNQGNISFFVMLKIEKNWTKEQICHYITERLVEKSLVPNPYRKLYLMFCMEALYDPDFENLFRKLESDSFHYLMKCMENCENIKYEPKDLMSPFSRIINAFLFVQNLFSDSDTLLEKQSLIYDFYYKIICNMISEQ